MWLDWVEVEFKFFVLLELVCDFWELIDGVFDIILNVFLKLWGFFKCVGWFFFDEEIVVMFFGVGMCYVEFDVVCCGIRFKCDDVLFNLGGIGKGYVFD